MSVSRKPSDSEVKVDADPDHRCGIRLVGDGRVLVCVFPFLLRPGAAAADGTPDTAGAAAARARIRRPHIAYDPTRLGLMLSRGGARARARRGARPGRGTGDGCCCGGGSAHGARGVCAGKSRSWGSAKGGRGESKEPRQGERRGGGRRPRAPAPLAAARAPFSRAPSLLPPPFVSARARAAHASCMRRVRPAILTTPSSRSK